MIQQDLVKHVYSIATETGDDQSNLAVFLVKLDKIVKGEEDSFTLVFKDPLDNSVITSFDCRFLFYSTSNELKLMMKI